MSKYTTEVRFICETASGLSESEGYKSVNDIITSALPKVFDFDFPIFDESYRNVLERKILKHYYTREIGEETVGLWKLRLDTRLNEIMPYYNKLYKSELLEFNPLYEVDYTRVSKKDTVGKVTDDGRNGGSSTRTDNLNHTRTDNLKSERTDDLTEVRTDDLTGVRTDDLNEHSHVDGKDKYSDTPQGSLTGVLSDSYLTNARVTDTDTNVDNTGTQITENTGTVTRENDGKQTVENTGTQTDTNSGTVTNVDSSTNHNDRDITNTDDYLEHVSGKTSGASYSELLMKFRDTFLNIDMRIIEELDDLFMCLW